MKFRIHILIFLVVMIFGCTTLPPHDYGVYNQGDIGDDELVTLVFDGTLYLRSFNGENVWWGIAPDKGFILKMPAGNYVFPLNWEVGINHWKNIDLQINLEPGKTYSIKSNLKGLVLTITATDDETRNVVSSAVREFSGYRTVEARKLPSSEEIRARLANNPNLIRPNDVLGKRLSGSDESGTFVFIFSDNNILEYTLNGKIYIGEWQYDESGPPILRYKIDWNEDGEPKGYGVDILRREGNNAVIQGYWYLTDAQIQFRKEVVIEE